MLVTTTTNREADGYDEFAWLQAYADHEGIPWKGRPPVSRRFFDVGEGRRLSGLVWGEGEPELVLLHGGGQNAHTWDSVAMALDRPLVALDLPGHGHSSWRADRDYWPWANAEAVAAALAQVAPRPKAVVGMSLGGLTTFRLGATRPELVPKAVVVDVTPGVGARTATMTQEQRGATALVAGPSTYASFEEMLDAVAATLPGRPRESLRPGLRHNARRLDDGRWAWRYDRLRPEGDEGTIDFTALWEDVAAMPAPLLLVRGGRSAHVHDDDVAELRRRKPDSVVEVVEGAGHSVQSDRPVVLARLIDEFVAGAP